MLAFSVQVRIVVHSSLHAQNETLAAFLDEEPDLPSTFPQNISSKFMSTIPMSRISLVRAVEESCHMQAERLEDNLVLCTVSITDSQRCPIPRSSPFLLRTMSILWRQFVCGNTEADLAWANPTSLIPLRIHSFASVLHLLGGACLYFSTNGATQLDGGGKWNVSILGRVVALLFDEKKLFGSQAVEEIDEDFLMGLVNGLTSKSGSPPCRKQMRKGRHVRNTMDLYNQIQDTKPRDRVSDEDVSSFSVEGLTSSTMPFMRQLQAKGNQRDGDSSKPEPVPATVYLEETSSEIPIPNTTSYSNREKSDIRIDSKSDFQSALRAAAALSGDDFDRVQNDEAEAAHAMIKAFGGVSNTGGRLWMTAPTARALDTIREGDDDAEPLLEDSFSNALVTKIESPAEDEIHTMDEQTVRQGQKKGVRQFRIPHSKKEKLDGDTSSTIASVDTHLTSNSVPMSDDIESVGLPFLDVIGRSLGME
jgi:hypothetical protein